MQLSALQKLGLALVFLGIRFLAFLEYLGTIPEKVFFNTYRLSFAIIIVVSIFFAFSLDWQNADTNGPKALSYYVGDNIQLPTVLGTTVVQKEIPVKVNKIPFPQITAQAVYIYDSVNEKLLYEINSDQQFLPASTTKLMTAIIASELYEPNDVVVIPRFCTQIESQKAGFLAGEEILAKDLLYTLLISSSGDAACALAAGRPPINFVELMNLKASEIELTNTQFSNAIGLDALNNNQITSAKDLYTLSQHALANPQIREIVKLKEYELTSGAVSRKVTNTNRLLWEVEGTVGVKTGTTTGAGEVLSYQYSKDNIDIAIIVMKSANRFEDTKKALNWALESYSWE